MQSIYTLTSGRNKFREDLCKLYDVAEVDSLFSIVVEKVLGFTRTQQLLQMNDTINSEKWSGINSILLKLIEGEPLQYIINESEFYGLQFRLDSKVLIPRQETELLVDLIIEENKGKSVSIIDIGTGSGCIAITLKKHLPEASITAVDISEEALEVARQNALMNNVEISFKKADILSGEWQSEGYDIIVSNPPYVMNSEKELMKSNVLKFEPHLALFVPDNDALKFYRAISTFASSKLNPDGKVWLEINESLGKETADLFIGNNLRQAKVIQDLNGKERIVKAW